jgi:hypothetical protein
MYADELKVRRKPQWYFGSGYREAWTVLTTVEQYGAHVEAMRSVLEFGCGSGRVIRHFRYVDGLRLAATDANSKPVEWDRKNLPGSSSIITRWSRRSPIPTGPSISSMRCPSSRIFPAMAAALAR